MPFLHGQLSWAGTVKREGLSFRVAEPGVLGWLFLRRPLLGATPPASGFHTQTLQLLRNAFYFTQPQTSVLCPTLRRGGYQTRKRQCDADRGEESDG